MPKFEPVWWDHFTDVLSDIKRISPLIRDNVDSRVPSGIVMPFLSEDNQSGFCLVGEYGSTYLYSVFSTVKGRGDDILTTVTRLADALKLDLRLECYEGYLVQFFARYGFQETYRGARNWEVYPKIGNPVVVYMTRKHS